MLDCLAEYLCTVNITQDIADNCENPMFSGMSTTAYIFNREDITNVTTHPENAQLITGFSLKPNTRKYAVVNQRTNPFTGTNTTVEVGDYRNTFTRTVSLFVPMDGAGAVKNIIDPLANGKFVIVLENDYVNEARDNQHPIIGLDRGLVVSSMTQTKYENNDYWVVELQETGVPTANKFLLVEEIVATESLNQSFQVYVEQSDLFVNVELANTTIKHFAQTGQWQVESDGVTFYEGPMLPFADVTDANHNHFLVVTFGSSDGITYGLRPDFNMIPDGDYSGAPTGIYTLEIDKTATARWLCELVAELPR